MTGTAILLAVGGLAWAHSGHVALPDVLVADSLLVEKVAHRLTLFADGRAVKTYRVALGRGGLAPKAREGNLLVPERRYALDSRVERSAHHRALHVSYPDLADEASDAAS